MGRFHNCKSYTTFFNWKSHGIWLRDHCKCPKCFHQVTRQRLLDTSQLPIDIQPRAIKILSNHKIQLDWYDDHSSTFDTAWLQENSYFPNAPTTTSSSPSSNKVRKFWGSELKHDLPRLDYKQVIETDSGLLKWLQHIDTFGIGFVENVPTTPHHTQKLAERIGFIRQTHYGGLWDFTSNLEHGDTAYTQLALPAHTDTTYFTDPCGLQSFHLLHHNGTGGDSLFVDGFHIADELLVEKPWAFDILSQYRVQAHSAGDKLVLIQPQPKSGFPILNLDPVSQELYQIRFNNDDRSVLKPEKGQDVIKFYAALKEWTLLLKRKRNELWIKLQPGTVVMFNNWRVLHGRGSFTGSRRLVGCYIGMDEFTSKLKILGGDARLKKFL